MPDYKATPVNVKAAINASTDKKWTATENGWLHINTSSLTLPSVPSNSRVYIDGVVVARSEYNSGATFWRSDEATVAPISLGDIVTYSSSGYNGDSLEINFYPCKAV